MPAHTSDLEAHALNDTSTPRRDISFFILRYLLENTDSDHGVSPAAIASAFRAPESHGISWLKPNKITEKTVLAHLRSLRSLGSALPFGVTVKQFGDLDQDLWAPGAKATDWFADKPLTTGDMRLMADALSATRLDPEDLEAVRTKLAQMAGVEPERLLHGYTNDIDDHLIPGIRRNVEALERAIAEHTTVTFDYGHFNVKGSYDFAHTKRYEKMYPHGLIFKKGIYYFLTSHDRDVTENDVLNLVVERISNITVNDSTEGEKPWEGSNFDFMKYSLERPYMYSGPATDIELFVRGRLDGVFSSFPNARVKILSSQKQTFLVRIRAELTSIKWWVLQYSESVTVLRPPELANMIRETATKVAKRYSQLDERTISALLHNSEISKR